ncbi:KLRBC protein, partial [Ptilonorhynchus violaceus]|nr:KLRBC protein [Ptilonorhynchus violaceus]
QEDCRDQGAMLLLLWDQDELKFLNETLQKPTWHFWIGLWVPTARTRWMWVNGSHLDRDRFQLHLREVPGGCGMIKGKSIIPDNCDSALQWICQSEATKL